MKKIFRFLFVAVLLLRNIAGIAQPGFYIPQFGKVFFKKDSATIFSNVINQGTLGLGENAFLNFKGKTWENDPASLITDESFAGTGTSGNGGWIRFYADSFRQQINGGYNAATKTGPSFPHIQVQNNLGIELLGSSTNARREIRFSDGHIYLGKNIFSVRDGDPGIISGYDSSKYFVTNNNPGSGLLMRENIIASDGRIDFPVGSNDQSYTPAAVHNISPNGDDYYVNVFDSVKSEVQTGQNLISTTVNKTWEIGTRMNGGGDGIEIFLQHLIKDEGSYYRLNRQYSYVAQYTLSGWDLGHPQNLPARGAITSGDALQNSGLNSRIFYNNGWAPSYFTKMTGRGDDIIRTRILLDAYRIDPEKVNVFWTTNPESHVKHFVVQRRLSSEGVFSSRDTVASQVFNGGASMTDLNYRSIDANSYTGISFYRIKVINYDNTFSYSNIVSVGGKPQRPSTTLWPNPTPDKFFIGLNGSTDFKAIIIWDASGQKMKEELINGRSVIEMEGLIAGNYMVGIMMKDGTIFETKKLVVIGK